MKINIKNIFFLILILIDSTLKSQTDGKVLDKTIAVVGGQMWINGRVIISKIINSSGQTR